MRLTLNVLRCPPAVAPETRTLIGGEFTIGRGPGVDWVLGDVNQMVSRRHCTVAFRAGEWQITDESANGTFANSDEGPIGKGERRVLHDHDRLRIGPYEIEILLEQDGTRRPSAFGGAPASDFEADQPFGEPFWRQEPASPFIGRTQDDHSSALEDGFRPPSPIGSLPVPHGQRIPGERIPADELLPEGWDSDPLGEPSAVTPPARETLSPPSAERGPPGQPSAVASADMAAPPADLALLTAFLAGAGLPDARLPDPIATMKGLGETFRALVSGLRAALIARASIKSEFRIEQTLIQARNNNPLKFSAGDDDALSALLGLGRHIDIAPAKAVADTLRDMRLHELASMAAMQAAARALLERLDPDKLQAALQQGGRSLLPANRKAKAWDAYETLYSEISRALSDDFDSVFGKAFARAYEEALEDLTAQDRRGGRM